MVGILNAFNGIAKEKATGLAAVAGGISEALVTTAVGLFVAIPAVMMFNYLTGRVEAFDVEMDNSSSELIDYFLKRRSMRRSVGCWSSRSYTSTHELLSDELPGETSAASSTPGGDPCDRTDTQETEFHGISEAKRRSQRQLRH